MVNIIDPDEKTTADFSYKMQVLMQVNKVRELGNVEWKGGYKTIKHVSTGVKGVEESVEVYIPDTRETFKNAVIILDCLLFNKFKKDKDMLDVRKKHYDREYKDKDDMVYFYVEYFREICTFLDKVNWLDSIGRTVR